MLILPLQGSWEMHIFALHQVDNQHPCLAEDTFLFHQIAHLQTQLCEKKWLFSLYFANKRRYVAHFPIFQQKNSLFSPFQAPFGGAIFEPTLQVEILYLFLENIENYCTQILEAKRIYIKLYPQCYAPTQSSLLTHYLLKKGYSLDTTELNYHFDIQANGNFDQKLHHSEKRKLAQCYKQHFEFRLAKTEWLEQAYRIIYQNRERKQKPISLSLEQLQNLFVQFPHHFLLACLLDCDKAFTVVSTAVLVKINSKIIYYFMPADNFDYQRFSPSILLLRYIYDWAKEQHFRILDLGISTENGKENFGLMRFKQNLGAEVSLKLTWYKSW
ncbi:MAG: GNAT family N-acetyltransferase [Microscillaceae bacterium]|nr:GNAT family N-acetyltransferase [Microscillaceae bacterium]MDW8459969.1 GNAT family N-acetyltransferase [Cytophagales bacterium]